MLVRQKDHISKSLTRWELFYKLIKTYCCVICNRNHTSQGFFIIVAKNGRNILMSLFDIGSINILMGQCYAGGFIDNLMYDRMVITTACGGHEQSWTCPDRPYDEFVYHWICAVNGADEMGNPVDADSNGDGEVSMAEAFEYAKSHDRVNETPLFVSQPQDLGSRWSFSNPGNIPTDFMEQRTDDNEPAEIWSLSGIRSQSSSANGVYIMHQGKKTRKVIRKK